MSRGPKRPTTINRPTSAPPLTPVLSSPQEEQEAESAGNVSQIAPRDFFTVALPNGGEVGVRPEAVLWYQSAGQVDTTEVGMVGGKVLEIPIDAKRFASRLRNFK